MTRCDGTRIKRFTMTLGTRDGSGDNSWCGSRGGGGIENGVAGRERKWTNRLSIIRQCEFNVTLSTERTQTRTSRVMVYLAAHADEKGAKWFDLFDKSNCLLQGKVGVG